MAQDQLIKYNAAIIGGSAGSLDVILKIIPLLPLLPDLFYILVVHRKNDADSILPQLIASRTTLNVKEVEDKEPITGGTIFIAPPDYHLLLENNTEFSLDTSEKLHHSRPSIDISFESVADVYGEHAIGILLSGANADGAEGLKIIQDRGGLTIVQDPQTADVPYMPQQAILMNAATMIVPAPDMPDVIQKILTGKMTDKKYLSGGQ